MRACAWIPAIKTRLAGITELLELLQQRSEPVDGDAEAALIPHVLPCLRDHNAKLAQSALEILELLVRRVPEATVRGYWQLLWSGIAERLGDSKLHVRAKAVDVVVALSEALDIDTVLEKLKVRLQRALQGRVQLCGETDSCDHARMTGE